MCEGIRVELIVRGETLGFVKDELLRNHLPRMFALIKNESKGIEDDQIPLRVFIKCKDSNDGELYPSGETLVEARGDTDVHIVCYAWTKGQ